MSRLMRSPLLMPATRCRTSFLIHRCSQKRSRYHITCRSFDGFEVPLKNVSAAPDRSAGISPVKSSLGQSQLTTSKIVQRCVEWRQLPAARTPLRSATTQCCGDILCNIVMQINSGKICATKCIGRYFRRVGRHEGLQVIVVAINNSSIVLPGVTRCNWPSIRSWRNWYKPHSAL